MVRLDGNVDVSGLIKNGSYVGNGGQVYVDSAFIYQNGSIFANGVNGGHVQYNVGAAMFGPSAMVQANGYGGAAGSISVNATGGVDIQKGALFDASGRAINTAAGYSDNVNINLIGSSVNNAGIVRANAVALSDGHLKFVANDANDVANLSQAAHAVPVDTVNQGGTIKITATDDSISNSGTIQANGVDGIASDVNGSAGGRFIATARSGLFNSGVIEANGGNGFSGPTPGNGGACGLISLNVLSNIQNDSTGIIQANGGQGGDNTPNPYDTYNAYLYQRGPGHSLGGDFTLAKGTVDLSNNPVAAGGNGGQGGVVTLSYGATALNTDGLIAANGGNGGKGASAFVSTIANAGSRQAAVARATALGGKGGNGGQGGLIEFSVLNGGSIEYTNPNGSPTGAGLVSAIGGNGGAGGNAYATAGAVSVDSQIGGQAQNAYANATATGGAGGKGGLGGWIITPHPDTFTLTNVTHDGVNGTNGLAQASARALSTSFAFANATVKNGGPSSVASSIGTAIDVGNPFLGYHLSSGVVSDIHHAFSSNQYFSLNKSQIADLINAPGDPSNHIVGVASSASRKPGGPDDGKVYAPNGYQYALGTSQLSLSTPPSVPSNHPVLTALPNEVILQGNTAILLANNAGLEVYRSVTHPFGGALPTEFIRHFVAANQTDTNLGLGKPSGFLNLDNLTSLAITSNIASVDFGTWTVGRAADGGFTSLSPAGGNLSILVGDNMASQPNAGFFSESGQLLSFGRQSGGSIAISTGYRLDSDGIIQTNAGNAAAHGGSIILKAGQIIELEKSSQIKADGLTMGGRIALDAGFTSANNGLLSANSLSIGRGGIITVNGLYAVNDGLIQANSAKPNVGAGGFIRLNGDQLALNGLIGEGSNATITATGAQGGRILLSSSNNLTGGIGNLGEYSNSGISITQGTLPPLSNPSLVTNFNPYVAGSAITFGALDARGSVKSGRVDLAGDNQAALITGTTVNGVTLGSDLNTFFASLPINSLRLVAGSGATASVIGQ